MSELDEVRTMARWVGILFVAALLMALTAAVILNLRYKPLGTVEGGVAYVDTWTGEPKFCIPSATRVKCVD